MNVSALGRKRTFAECPEWVESGHCTVYNLRVRLLHRFLVCVGVFGLTIALAAIGDRLPNPTGVWFAPAFLALLLFVSLMLRKVSAFVRLSLSLSLWITLQWPLMPLTDAIVAPVWILTSAGWVWALLTLAFVLLYCVALIIGLEFLLHFRASTSSKERRPKK